ncbi:MAG: hypothetical protein B6D41_15435 [Chloroflexi bacterium UTCFX4]|jgi:hypothetical protein|nr:MAG: hypothetical protein B6D41_15435 [Chloroflexi bacterium UTCFX4]
MEQPRVNVGVLLRRQLIPVAIAIGVGIIVLLGQFISNATLDDIVGLLVSWGALVAAFALLLGLANLILFHTQRILKRDREMPFSILILVSALVVFLLALPSGGTDAPSQWVMRYIYQPLEASFLALLVFFIGTAVYRALRVRTWEMAFFALSAVIVLIGSAPFMSVVSPFFPALRDWVINVPALAGGRGILLGVALGVIATGLRLLTGIDRPYSE